jgi:hypothetical protein
MAPLRTLLALFSLSCVWAFAPTKNAVARQSAIRYESFLPFKLNFQDTHVTRWEEFERESSSASLLS